MIGLVDRLRISRNRLADDTGHVGVLMAMVIFVVLGALMMTWNTAQLSKEKMRLQNAADAAALGFCSWQARGMNTVQNLNDEMYVALKIATKLLNVAGPMEITAQILEKGASIPFIGPILKIAAQAFHIIAAITGGISGLLANRICPWILKPLGYFYAYGSCALGYWGAQQLAAKNRADPLGNVDIKVLGANLGFYAIGVAWPLIDTLKLPIDQDNESAKMAPWKGGYSTANPFDNSSGIYKAIHKMCGTGGKWEVKPWISVKKNKKPLLPGPSIWIAHKYRGHIETLDLSAWSAKASKLDAMPMIAIAAAQCVTGDIVSHSKSPKEGTANQRPAGFGTGATAKLIPVETAISGLSTNQATKMVSSGIGKILYH